MYTKEMYKSEIKKFITDKSYDPISVADRTFNIFTEHVLYIDDALHERLIDIFTMEMGPEFEMTEAEFNDFLEKM